MCRSPEVTTRPASGSTSAARWTERTEERQPVGTREEPVPTGHALPSGLIGGFSVDGEVETHLLRFRLDPEPEEEADDLDDDEGADDRVGDRGADRDELIDELLR